MKYLIGFDAGTTSFKAVLLDENGNVAASAKTEYILITDGNKVEFPPEEYWSLFCSVTKELFEKSDINPQDAQAIAISSQGETFICMDSDGSSIGNAIVWLDSRSNEECDDIRCVFSPEEIYTHTGQCEIDPTWTATKILWIKKHEPQRFAITQKFLLLEDYLIFRLTGRYICEKALPSSTLLYDIPSGKWWGDMLSFIGIDENRLPDISESAAKVSEITTEAAIKTGLPAGIPVVTGALDQIAAMVGSGNVIPGKITEVIGSCLVAETVLDEFPKYKPDIRITCQPFCIPGSYLSMMFSNTAGMTLKWFRDCFITDETNYKTLCAEAEKISPGSDGLIMLPHLAGSRFPVYNPDARGIFYGISMEHRRGHFVRSILEAVAYTEKSILDELSTSARISGDITVLGGGADNDVWNSIRASVHNRPIHVLLQKESASVGAAILAGVGCGMFDNIYEACKILKLRKGTYIPDKELIPIYKELYKNITYSMKNS